MAKKNLNGVYIETAKITAEKKAGLRKNEIYTEAGTKITPVAKTSAMTQDVGIGSDNKLYTKPSGITPVSKTGEMTQDVGIGSDGKLYTKPAPPAPESVEIVNYVHLENGVIEADYTPQEVYDILTANNTVKTAMTYFSNSQSLGTIMCYTSNLNLHLYLSAGGRTDKKILISGPIEATEAGKYGLLELTASKTGNNPWSDWTMTIKNI